MDENIELLTHIYETAEMGSYTITTLINKIKNKENKIKFMLEKEIKEYEKYIKLTEKLITKKGATPKKTSFMAKMGSNIGIMKETMMDNSDAALAQMLIEGITMGVTTVGAKMSSYKKNADRKILRLAANFVEFQEEEIEKLKAYI
jgi:hypothetical protein